MYTNEQFDLSVLPEQAQTELYDFYLFLKQRYQNKEKQSNKNDKILIELLELTKQQAIGVDSDIDIRGLIDQTHNVELRK